LKRIGFFLWGSWCTKGRRNNLEKAKGDLDKRGLPLIPKCLNAFEKKKKIRKRGKKGEG